MSIVLRNQVEASEKSAQELESLVTHRQAVLCHDVEALMEQVVAIHRRCAERLDLFSGRQKLSHGSGSRAAEVPVGGANSKITPRYMTAT